MTIAQLHKKSQRIDFKSYISQAVNEVLTDPDFGMELSAKAKKRLHDARTTKGKTSSLAEIKKKYY